MSKRNQPCLLTHVFSKASVDMILTAHLMGIKNVDGIAYSERILSVSCLPRTILRGNVANFPHLRKLDLYVKRCGLQIFV
jgi:hypothetical protein